MKKVIIIKVDCRKSNYDEDFIRHHIEEYIQDDPHEMDGYAGLSKFRSIEVMDAEEYADLMEKAWMYEDLST